MKNKIIKLLEKPKTIIPISIAIAVIAGILIFIFVGRPPQVNIDYKNSNSGSESLSQSFADGEELSLAFVKSGRISNVPVKAGDIVHKGQVLAELTSTDASGAVSQAAGALEVAKANYEKILNGATGTDIDVLKTSVTRAENNLEKTISTQQTLVQNAYYNLLNSTPEARPKDGTGDYIAPIISGNYNLGKEGTIKLVSYYSAGGSSFSATGLTEGTGTANSITSQPIGDSGLFIKFPSTTNININDWVIEIPNKKASNYLQNYNAYQAALKGQAQAVSLATSDLDQARATLNAKQAAARPEDVAIAKAQVDSAQGALEIAQTAYNNNFIYAQADGVITVVNAKVGEISIMNQKAIGMTVKLNTNK